VSSCSYLDNDGIYVWDIRRDGSLPMLAVLVGVTKIETESGWGTASATGSGLGYDVV
jgi:hypothetical protein